MPTESVQMGILVGGRSRRMAGFPKGLLPHPGGEGSLVDHLCSLARQLEVPYVLVGNNHHYHELGYPIIEDAVPDAGPIGGLLALLEHARAPLVLLTSCDLPKLQKPLLELLVSTASNHPDAPAIMPARDDMLEPTCAIYRPALALPSLRRACEEGRRGLQRWARRNGAVALGVPEPWLGWLDDWDTPEDVWGEGAER